MLERVHREYRRCEAGFFAQVEEKATREEQRGRTDTVEHWEYSFIPCGGFSRVKERVCRKTERAK